MAAVAYSALLPDVLPMCEGVPQVMALHAIRNAAIELCEESLIHRAVIDMAGADLTSGSLTVIPGAGMRVVRIMGAMFNGRALIPTNTDELDRALYPSDWRTMQGETTHYVCYAPDVIGVFRLPETTADMRIDAVVAPSMDSVEYDEAIISRFRQGIADGAIARLMLIPGKPWSNPQQSRLHAQLFSAAKADARVAANLSNTRDTLRVEFPRA